ncbi:uncharacterized protein LOC117782194 [Drosophila innubila]|uniref:uncharacterized protein LOC117782194 n=1 Tax=Drosophila innubila TaxID=198719 RepID=UPI00148B5FBC|nr:uncharacterized protein LOC117782194 [Drosophila innubila]
MCKSDCACMDDMCCSLRGKSIFLACWTLAHTIVLIITTFLSFCTGIENPYVLANTIIITITHMLGSIFLFVGIYKEKAWALLLGIIFSSIMPYLNLILIYLPTVQIIFTITSCRYYKILQGGAAKQ